MRRFIVTLQIDTDSDAPTLISDIHEGIALTRKFQAIQGKTTLIEVIDGLPSEDGGHAQN